MSMGRGHVRRRGTSSPARAFASAARSRGDADDPGAPLDHVRPADLPVPRLAPYKDLPPQPGWEPVGSDGKMWAEVLRAEGWTTGYMTDNPHILLGVHKRFRGKFDRVELVDGPGAVAKEAEARGLASPRSTSTPSAVHARVAPEPRMAAYLAANPRDRKGGRLPVRPGISRTHGLGRVGARPRRPSRSWSTASMPHEPWDVPRRLSDIYGTPNARAWSRSSPSRPPPQIRAARPLAQLLRRMRQLYAAEVTLVDTWLGKFVDRLADLGVPDNTLLVLCSDHGVLLGEYGWVGKRYTEVHTELEPGALRYPSSRAQGQGAHESATGPPPTTSGRPCSRSSARRRPAP